MIIKELHLKNFISYSDANVSFPLGVIVVVGENGAGKTALLDGITYALLKEHSRGRDENLIKRGETNASIKLKFLTRGKEYEVEWKLSRDKSATGSLKHIEGNNSRLLVIPGSGERTILPEIMKLTGLDKGILLNAIYVRQGEIAGLLGVQPSKRKEIIGQLLGIDELEKIWRAMKEPIDALEKEGSNLEGRLNELPAKYEKLREIGNKILSAENKCEELYRKLNEVSQRMENVRNALNELEEKARRFQDLRTKIAKLEGECGEMRARLSNIDDRLNRLESVRKAFQDCEIYRSYYEESEQIKEELEKLRNERGDIEGKIKALKSKQNNIEVKKGKKQLLEKSKEQMLNKLEGILKKFEEVAGFHPKLNELLASYQEIYQGLENYSQELERILEEKEGAKEKYKTLKTVSGVTGFMTTIFLVIFLLAIPIASPLLSILPLIIAAPLMMSLSRKEKKLENEISEIRNEIKGINGKITSLEGMKEDVASIPDKLQKIIEEIKALDEEIKALEIEVQDLEHLEKRHDDITSKITNYEKRLKEIREPVEKYIRAEGILSQADVKTREELEEKINQLNQDKLALMDELKRYEELLKRAKEELNMLGYDESEHQSKKEEYKELQEEKSEVEVEIAKIRGEIESLKEQEENIRKEIDELEALRETYERLNQYIDSLERIRDRIFHKDALQRVIRRHAVILVEEYARRFLQEFGNLQFYDINLDEDFNIIVRGPAGEQTFEMLSGGEKIAIALILRLSVAASLVGETLECLIMDEPTIHLDSERRRELVNLLKNFKGGGRLIRQVIIVSHDRELEEAADVIYEVVRSEGTSKIRQPYQSQ
jgi:exonuclease SbcC